MSSCVIVEEELSADFRRELLSLIDGFLISVTHQSLIDGDFVRDFILDMRNVLNPVESREFDDTQQ